MPNTNEHNTDNSKLSELIIHLEPFRGSSYKTMSENEYILWLAGFYKLLEEYLRNESRNRT
jgi:hypothetical protein